MVVPEKEPTGSWNLEPGDVSNAIQCHGQPSPPNRLRLPDPVRHVLQVGGDSVGDNQVGLGLVDIDGDNHLALGQQDGVGDGDVPVPAIAIFMGAGYLWRRRALFYRCSELQSPATLQLESYFAVSGVAAAAVPFFSASATPSAKILTPFWRNSAIC